MQYVTNDATTKYYAKILNGTDKEIIKGWDNLLEQQCKMNGNPERLRAIHAKEKNSKDSLLFARIDLMTYGWLVSANHTINYVYETYNYSRPYRIATIFEKAFLTIKIVECTEP